MTPDGSQGIVDGTNGNMFFLTSVGKLQWLKRFLPMLLGHCLTHGSQCGDTANVTQRIQGCQTKKLEKFMKKSEN
jgi:hypothetical protein